MKENEAIKLHIKENLKRIITIKEFLKTNSDANDKECNEDILILTSANVALKEIQQYRAIGTVEECRESVERQMAKKPIKVDSGVYDYDFDYECPNCKENIDDYEHHCKCGQAIDFSEV